QHHSQDVEDPVQQQDPRASVSPCAEGAGSGGTIEQSPNSRTSANTEKCNQNTPIRNLFAPRSLTSRVLSSEEDLLLAIADAEFTNTTLSIAHAAAVRVRAARGEDFF